MSKTYPKKIYPPEKNVFMSNTIPDTFIDNIRTLTNAGDYGKLEELLINYPVKLNFTENKLNTSLLHNVIRSPITNTQKLRLVTLLIKYGIPVNNLDESGFSPLYYAIQLQLPEIVKVLINRSFNVNILPKNYDYFRLALSPNIVNCKPQLINQNESYMGKYYSQQLEIERDFRKIINEELITQNVVKYILDFAKRLPDQELTYIDMNDNTIKTTNNVKLLGTEYTNIFPLFENKIKKLLDSVTDNIKSNLDQGKYNQDQLITAKIELIKSIKVELSTMLNTSSVLKETLKTKQPYEYESNDEPNDIYEKFIDPTIYYNISINDIIDKYVAETDQLMQNFEIFKKEVTDKLLELMGMESTLMSNYPIFSSGEANELPMLINFPNPVPADLIELRRNAVLDGIEAHAQNAPGALPGAGAAARAAAPAPPVMLPGTLLPFNIKLRQRLFYDSALEVNPANIRIQIQQFRGGNVLSQSGGIVNKLDAIITLFTTELKNKQQGSPVPGNLLHSRVLYQNIDNGLNSIFSNQPIAGVLDVGITPDPALGYAAPWDNITRSRIDNIKNNLVIFKSTLANISTQGIIINNLLNESKINFDTRLTDAINEYNTLISKLYTTFNAIYNIHNIYNNVYPIPNGTLINVPVGAVLPGQPLLYPITGYFNNLLQYLNTIINSVNNLGNNIIIIDSFGVPALPALPVPPNNIQWYVHANPANPFNMLDTQGPNLWIDPTTILRLQNHLYYDKIEPLFNYINEELSNIPLQYDDDVEFINIFRRKIYLLNSSYALISNCIEQSNLSRDINKNLNLLNSVIDPILTPAKITAQFAVKKTFLDKIAELRGYIEEKKNQIDFNIKKFNNFIIELNNISEINLLYNKFNPDNETKKFLFNDSLVLYKHTTTNNVLYDIDSLSLYSENKNLQMYFTPDDTPDNKLFYRLPVSESNLIMDNTKCVMNQKVNNRKEMMRLFGKSVALTLPMYNVTDIISTIIIYNILSRINNEGSVNNKINALVAGINTHLSGALAALVPGAPGAVIPLDSILRPIILLLQNIQILPVADLTPAPVIVGPAPAPPVATPALDALLNLVGAAGAAGALPPLPDTPTILDLLTLAAENPQDEQNANVNIQAAINVISPNIRNTFTKIIRMVTETIKESIKKVGTLVGENFYASPTIYIKDTIIDIITRQNPIILAIQKVLGQIISGIDPVVAKDTAINTAVKRTKEIIKNINAAAAAAPIPQEPKSQANLIIDNLNIEICLEDIARKVQAGVIIAANRDNTVEAIEALVNNLTDEIIQQARNGIIPNNIIDSIELIKNTRVNPLQIIYAIDIGLAAGAAVPAVQAIADPIVPIVHHFVQQPLNPILNRFLYCINQIIITGNAEHDRQNAGGGFVLPHRVEVLEIVTYCMIMRIALEGLTEITLPNLIVRFDNLLELFNLQFNIVFTDEQKYMIAATIISIDKTINKSMAAGIASVVLYCNQYPLAGGVRDQDEINIMISSITVFNSIINDLSEENIILSSAMSRLIVNNVINLYDNQLDNRMYLASYNQIIEYVPNYRNIINTYKQNNTVSLTGISAAAAGVGVVIPLLAPLNNQELINVAELSVKLDNEISFIVSNAKLQCISNMDNNLLKFASSISIAGIAYFNVPYIANTMVSRYPMLAEQAALAAGAVAGAVAAALIAPVVVPNEEINRLISTPPIIGENALITALRNAVRFIYVNLDNSIQLSSNIIIPDENRFINVSIISGIAATSAMVIADNAGTSRIHELFVGPDAVNRIGAGVPVPAAPAAPAAPDLRSEIRDSAIELFNLGFDPEVSIIASVATILHSKLQNPNFNIINVGVIQAAKLINLSDSEAILLGNVASFVATHTPIPNKNIVIAKISKLAHDLLKSGLPIPIITRSIMVHGNNINVQMDLNQLNDMLKLLLSTTIYLSGLSANAVAAIIAGALQPTDDESIEKISNNLGNINKLFMDNCSTSGIEPRRHMDSFNIYSNKLHYSNDNTVNWNDTLNTLIYVPENFKISNLNYLLSFYHEIVFQQLIQNPAFDRIKEKFQQENPTISEEKIITTLVIKILHTAIINNFNDILQNTLSTVANTLINNKLNEIGILNKFDNVDDQKIVNILRQKETKQILKRENIKQNFYLDENYMSSEPIDIISCLNNNVEIIKILKKKMSIKVKEYQDLIFKLGIKEILDEVNDITRNKITKVDLTRYISQNKSKYEKAIEFFNNQLKDEIESKELQFFIDDTVDINVKISELNLQLELDKETPILVVPNFPPPVASPWIYQLNSQNIYDDLIQNQVKSNIYLYEKIRIKLDYIFEFIVMPEITEFLQFFSDDELSTTITYDNLKENLKPLIGDIINYHLNIDPTKTKNEVIPLQNTLDKFSELIFGLLKLETDKQNIPAIYNDRLNIKILDFVTIVSKYYLNIYRNYLKYIFNEYRYSILIL